MTKLNFIISIFTVCIQYYEYHLFGFLAANISHHFFPANSIVGQLLNTYLIMSVAMIAKPLGALILGKIGDLEGRSKSFKISLIGTAIASFGISMTPSYESIGLLSAFILLICRMSICAFVSSGSDGVRIYIYEHIGKTQKCLGIGVTTLFTQVGSLAASLSAWFFTIDSLPGYSWRFAFLIGAIMGLLAVFIMQKCKFSDKLIHQNKIDFSEFKANSIKIVILHNLKLFIYCIMLAGCIGSTNQFLVIFFGTYNYALLQTVNQSLMHQYVSIAIICYMIFAVISGYLADKFGEYLILSIATFSTVVMSIILALQLNELIFNKIIFIAIATLMPFITMPAASIFKRSIPIAIRYRLFSLSHAVGSVLISAPTSYVSTFIYHKTNIAGLPILYFITTLIVIFLVINVLRKKQIIDEL